jgi:hypothetical protein
MKKRAFIALLGAGLFFAPIARAQIITATPNPVSPYAAASLFGTGADGAVTISSGTTTLTRDMQYTNLTLSGTGAINPHGFRIFVSGVFDISAAGANAVSGNANFGGNASGATAGGGAAAISNIGTTVAVMGGLGGIVGATGGTGVGAAGTSTAWGGGGGAAFGIGGVGGASGAGGSGVSAGGAAVSIAATYQASALFTQPVTGPFFVSQSGNGTFWPVCVTASISASGSAGGGDATNAGGGGGGSASLPQPILIYARFIQRGSNSTAGIIQSKGANGGNGGNSSAGNTGGGGGGGASGGGFIYVVAESLLGSAIANAIDVSGGAGGAGGNGLGTGKGGNGGSGGNGGNVQVLVIGATPSFTASAFNAAGTAGSTTVTATGAAGGAGATQRSNL